MNMIRHYNMFIQAVGRGFRVLQRRGITQDARRMDAKRHLVVRYELRINERETDQ
ncbi:MAG: hypothetical protein KKG95_07145 [Candidatus Omnitrophica bacterium]|nr:hypothetical protein [Candidatus Omnitrophota bacterium]MBU1785095.1 hypothetical protein [Candidatus Omnitrophota bacterium]